jgi:hypothetical protein
LILIIGQFNRVYSSYMPLLVHVYNIQSLLIPRSQRGCDRVVKYRYL